MRKIALILVSLVMASGCATVPIASPGARSVREAEECLKVGPCFLVRATNDGSYATAVSLNGAKIGEIAAWGNATFFVRESALKDGRCAQVSFYLILQGSRGQSESQCIERSGYFTLQLDNKYRIWLVPRRGV